MASRYMSDKDRDNIITLRDKGLSAIEIADIIGKSRNAITYVLFIYDAMNKGDVVEAQRRTLVHKAHSTYAWAARKLGLPETLPQEPPKEKVIEAPVMPESMLTPEKGKPEEKTNPELIEAAVFTAARLLIEKQHDEMEELGKLLCGKLDRLATIIQSCNMDAVQKSNANADNLLREVQSIKSHVEMIRSQTKRKR